MKLVRICAALLALAAAANAQRLTGRWEARMYQVDEGRKMILALTEQGATVIGYMQQSGGAGNAILNGTFTGSTLTFSVERPGRGARGSTTPVPPVRTDYTAVLQGDKLVLTIPTVAGRGGGGRGTLNPLEFTRVSTARPARSPRRRPKSISLPTPPSPITASPELRPWAGTVGTSSPAPSPIKTSAAWPMPWHPTA